MLLLTPVIAEFPINGASDYRWEYGDTRSP